MSVAKPCLTVHQLRRRWKPTKEAIIARYPDDATVIRLHRAFSWMQRCEACPEGEDHDLVLVCLWIAFNSLYGQWDEKRREPMPDRVGWQSFLSRIVKLDASGHVKQMLTSHRELVMSILDDEYLSTYFWEDPTDERAGKARRAKFDARTWYIDGKWSMVLERIVERIYLLRCQLVHGASTFNSKLNRTSLARCVTMMRHVMDATLLVIIDHGHNEDLGEMCYPPLTGKPA